MRGAREVEKTVRDFSRIIPADAGSTRSLGLHATTRWDHPRGCGEHRIWTFDAVVDPGSSPRMRGAHHLVQS